MIVYIEFLFLWAANFNFRVGFKKSYTIIPSIVTAFTSMCSIVTMPMTIATARKNLKNPDYAEMVIPMTTNVQMIGDCFVNAFLCILVMKIFGHPIPDFVEWAKFTLIFTLVRYATVGVSGGTTFLLLPLYEKYLHFNHEMLAIMLTFNVVLDPIITAANVAGNGVLVLLFEKFFNFISMKKGVYDRKIT
jgi:Na+/H+-dicarboxylate symporter